MSAPSLFTLVLQDHGFQLWDGTGGILAQGAELLDDEAQAALRRALPPRAAVQLLVAGSGMQVQCQDVPALAPGEAREVLRRLLPQEDGEPRNLAFSLVPDPLSEGGHVLWMAGHPRREMDTWVGLLAALGARPVFALPWARALLAGSGRAPGSALYLTLEAEVGHLHFFQGQGLKFARSFPLAGEGLPVGPEAPDPEALGRLLGEEVSLLVPYLQQKYRGAGTPALFTVGVPDALLPILRATGLRPESLGMDLPALLIAGARAEAQRKGRLDLVPEEVRQARQQRLLSLVLRAAVVLMPLLCAGTQAYFKLHTRHLEQEAAGLEALVAQRAALVREGEAAAGQRSGLLRVRWAEDRQVRAVEDLERLGLEILRAQDGLWPQSVEILQVPGDTLAYRFTVSGLALTDRNFSVGVLQAYHARLQSARGIRLGPMEAVAVMDLKGNGNRGEPDRLALTRFKLKGTAP